MIIVDLRSMAIAHRFLENQLSGGKDTTSEQMDVDSTI
jgi:hypothetical protein